MPRGAGPSPPGPQFREAGGGRTAGGRGEGRTIETRATFAIGQAVHDAPPLPAALHVVATPIGNLRDVTLRALEVLAAADTLAAEDTRHTRRLLDRYAIRRPLVACHEHNEAQMAERLTREIAEGRSVALVSDAGTPLVSDPGFRVVRAVREAGLPVVPVPGASAPVAALQACGLPTDAYTFAGFPPPKEAARRRMLEGLRAAPGTLLLFEAPHRLADSLADMAAVLGDRPAVVARELTKAHEELREGTLAALAAHYRAHPPKGEIVVCVQAGEAETAAPETVLRDLLGTMSASRAAAEAARLTGRSKRELYALALTLKDGA